jgi:Flp pilus assembly protein TadD
MRWSRIRSLGAAAGCAAAVVITAAALVAATTVRGIDHWLANRPLDDAARRLAAGDARAAARLLLPVVAARPENPATHYYLGVAYIRAGVPSIAIGQLSEAARLEPRDARVRGALGEAYRAVGTRHQALREFLQAVALDPGDPSYRAEAGNELLDDGRIEEALVQLREAVRLHPAAADVRVLLGLALCRAGDGAGMEREYRAAARMAAGAPLGELAHRLSESGARTCVAAHR